MEDQQSPKLCVAGSIPAFPVAKKIKCKGCVFVKVVDRETFNKMREAGLINDGKFNKSYVISSIHKKSKRKKIYMCEAVIHKYEKLLRSKSYKKYDAKG